MGLPPGHGGPDTCSTWGLCGSVLAGIKACITHDEILVVLSGLGPWQARDKPPGEASELPEVEDAEGCCGSHILLNGSCSSCDLGYLQEGLSVGYATVAFDISTVESGVVFLFSRELGICDHECRVLKFCFDKEDDNGCWAEKIIY